MLEKELIEFSITAKSSSLESMTFVKLVQRILLLIFLVHGNILLLFYQLKLTDEGYIFYVYMKYNRRGHDSGEKDSELIASHGHSKITTIYRATIMRMT